MPTTVRNAKPWEAGRAVLRNWVPLSLGVVAVAIVGLAKALGASSHSATGHTVLLGGAVVLAGFVGLAVLRASRLRVELDASGAGLVVRNQWRTHRLAASDLASAGDASYLALRLLSRRQLSYDVVHLWLRTGTTTRALPVHASLTRHQDRAVRDALHAFCARNRVAWDVVGA